MRWVISAVATLLIVRPACCGENGNPDGKPEPSPDGKPEPRPDPSAEGSTDGRPFGPALPEPSALIVKCVAELSELLPHLRG